MQITKGLGVKIQYLKVLEPKVQLLKVQGPKYIFTYFIYLKKMSNLMNCNQ